MRCLLVVCSLNFNSGITLTYADTSAANCLGVKTERAVMKAGLQLMRGKKVG